MRGGPPAAAVRVPHRRRGHAGGRLCGLRPLPDGGSRRARAAVWREEELAFIADLYSTASAVECRHGELELSEDCQRSTRRQNARELLETGVAVKSVVDTAVSCGAVQTGGGELRVPVRARCLYLDENDVLGSVSREFTVTCPADGIPEDGVCRGTACCGGDVLVNVVPEGIELRLPLEYALTTACRRRYACVCGGETVEDEAPAGPRPSLILRKLGRGRACGPWRSSTAPPAEASCPSTSCRTRARSPRTSCC